MLILSFVIPETSVEVSKTIQPIKMWLFQIGWLCEPMKWRKSIVLPLALLRMISRGPVNLL
jgi:hypothetical protein